MQQEAPVKSLLAADGSMHAKKMLAYLAAHGKVFGPKSNHMLFSVPSALPLRARAAVGKAAADRPLRR